MSRTTLLLAALLVMPACDDAKKADAAKPDADKTAKKDAKKDEAAPAKKDEAATPAKADDPWQAKLDSRVLADSGLGKDGKLSAFDIVNCESGEKYCQVCRFGGNPKLMAVGTVDDEAFHEDLKNLDAIAQKYGGDNLKAFAVITTLDGGKAVTPKDVAAAQKEANELREKLAIQMPVVVPAPDDGSENNRIWDEYYNITKSRTVMFADGSNKVQYSAVGPEDWSGLNEAIVSVVKG